jgi:hypothetical protein
LAPEIVTMYRVKYASFITLAMVVFSFRLSKQLKGEFEGMWMTDAVWPVGDAMVPQQGF